MTRRQPRRRRPKPNPWLVLRRSAIHGRGVYARRDIPAGTRLIEYTGELISSAEADRREALASEADHHTFLFIVGPRWCVDAAVGGNIARYINHTCDPNCEAHIEGRRIWIDAVRDIRAGEELGYEYEYDFLPGYTVEDLETYPCRCGSPRCRLTMVDVPPRKRHLLAQLKRRRAARRSA